MNWQQGKAVGTWALTANRGGRRQSHWPFTLASLLQIWRTGFGKETNKPASQTSSVQITNDRSEDGATLVCETIQLLPMKSNCIHGCDSKRDTATFLLKMCDYFNFLMQQVFPVSKRGNTAILQKIQGKQ